MVSAKAADPRVVRAGGAGRSRKGKMLTPEPWALTESQSEDERPC